eukprot:COSAG05_NODE_13779_length_418_cov_0.962382_1_plen_98_part_10
MTLLTLLGGSKKEGQKCHEAWWMYMGKYPNTDRYMDGIPYSVKTGGLNDSSATATSGMPLPRATSDNVYNISRPRVRLKWRVCAIAMHSRRLVGCQLR